MFWADAGTLWYRAPESLILNNCRMPMLDIWSIGCVLAELTEGKPLFPGINQLDQLRRCVCFVGLPEYDLSWMPAESLELCRRDFSKESQSLRMLMPHTPRDFRGLIERMLIFDPELRISASKALEHPCFFQFERPDVPVVSSLFLLIAT